MAGFTEEAGYTPTAYAEVPWHRKISAVNVFTLLFPLLPLATLLTGNVYLEKDGKAVALSGFRRWVHIIGAGLIALMWVLRLTIGKQ